MADDNRLSNLPEYGINHKKHTNHLIQSELERRFDELTEQNFVTILNCIDTIKENEGSFTVLINDVFSERSKKLKKETEEENKIKGKRTVY